MAAQFAPCSTVPNNSHLKFYSTNSFQLAINSIFSVYLSKLAQSEVVMIREMTREDFEAFWPSFQAIIKAQESYALEPEMSLEEAYHLWCEASLKSFVFCKDNLILGSYYIKPNGMGPSSHICNCGYMVSAASRGQGIARKLCQHSQQIAIELGFKAMQFNSVVASNQIAVNLWQKLGFKIVGSVPSAYKHATLGYVDSYIMYKSLED